MAIAKINGHDFQKDGDLELDKFKSKRLDSKEY
jgi:hypothetical protein